MSFDMVKVKEFYIFNSSVGLKREGLTLTVKEYSSKIQNILLYKIIKKKINLEISV